MGKWSLSSVRILKQCFSTYGDFNVLLQSVLQPGFRMVLAVPGTRAEQYPTHTAQTEFMCFICSAICALSWNIHVRQPRYSDEAKSNKSQTDS